MLSLLLPDRSSAASRPLPGGSPITRSRFRRPGLEQVALYNERPKVKPAQIPGDAWVVDLEDVEKETSRLLRRASHADRQGKATKTYFEAGDVLYGKLRPYLDKVVLADAEGYCTTEIVPITPLADLDPRWLRWSLKRPDFLRWVDELSYGVKMPRLGTKDAKRSLHPIPPVQEQRRIVETIDEFMRLLDDVEAELFSREVSRDLFRSKALEELSAATEAEFSAAWKLVQENWGAVVADEQGVEQVVAAARDLGVRGRIGGRSAGRDLADPAAVDLHTLGSDRLDVSKLWLPSCFESGFPAAWPLTPLGSLGSWGSGGTPTKSRTDYYEGGTIPWVVIGDLDGGLVENTETRITELGVEESSAKLIGPGAVLVAMYGASIGKLGVTGIECCTNQAIAHCVPDEAVVDTDYLMLVLSALVDDFVARGQGAAQPNISQTVLKHTVVPLPSLSEQRSIVEAVAEVEGLAGQLTETLGRRRTQEQALAASLVAAI